jgi:Putative transmembrane protein (PGPGW)
MTFPIRKVGVAVAGFGVLTFGVALIVLPGPAIVVIPLGLAILAKEFLWARKLLDEIKQLLRRLKARAVQAFGKAARLVAARGRLVTECSVT